MDDYNLLIKKKNFIEMKVKQDIEHLNGYIDVYGSMTNS